MAQYDPENGSIFRTVYVSNKGHYGDEHLKERDISHYETTSKCPYLL